MKVTVTMTMTITVTMTIRVTITISMTITITITSHCDRNKPPASLPLLLLRGGSLGASC